MCNHYEYNESAGVETKECLSCKHAHVTKGEAGSVNISCPHLPPCIDGKPVE